MLSSKPRPLIAEPRRLPREKSMTIAAGLLSQEGLVLCSDSQETISGYIKQDKSKVRMVVFRNFAFGVTGSGTTDYIDTAIATVFDDLPESATVSEICRTLKKNWIGFFDDHLSRWAYYPESERPTVELLIGLSYNDKYLDLFHCSGTIFHRVQSKAIGAGVLLANNLISQHYSWDLSINELTSIAIYILAKVKKHVDTCGGYTDIIAMRKGRDFAWAKSEDVEELERLLERIDKSANMELTRRISDMHLAHLDWLSQHGKPKKHLGQKFAEHQKSRGN